jgi:DNA-directed RNA polymerase subunit alpha
MTSETSQSPSEELTTPIGVTETFAPVAETAPEPEEILFDIRSAPIPSFGALQQGRSSIFQNLKSRMAFKTTVESMGTEGEEGRRKGLGLWMLGRNAEAVQLLAGYEGDDVASFTRANGLMSLSRPAEARPVFKRLSDSYPSEPRPRAGVVEGQLEADLQAGDEELALENLEQQLADAPADFADSAEGLYLRARAAELKRDWSDALDLYDKAHEIDPAHRSVLFRGAYLFERCGLDHRALEFYELLIKIRPIDRNTLFNLGVLYEDLGQDQDAAACYETIHKNFPSDPRARLYLQDARSAMNMYYDEDLERKEDRLNQILRTPITDFELSVRARNCLNKMNILTLGDLVKQTEQELLSYKNFGETSLNEIKEILNSKNLRLGMAHEEAVASIEASHRPKATGENAELMNKAITDLELSIRARRTVEALGALTVGEILKHSDEELLSMPNFGVTSLQELKRKLGELGLSLPEKG